jgi:ribosomal protein S18 acetylase RimI-like enzyme
VEEIVSEPSIRAATAADHPTAQEALVSAFDDDPVLNWFVRTDATRTRALGTAFRTSLEVFAPFGLTFVEGSGGGAALWSRHDQWQMSTWQELTLLPTYVSICGLGRFRRLVTGFDVMKAHHPREPHYYLYCIGVRADRQGQGIGARLLAPMLERCDAEGLPAYLESSKERNVPFYRRHGFEVREEIQFGPGGPPLWPMWRAPRPR